MEISNRPFTVDLVIARYKEPLDWLQSYSHYNFRNIIIYNKWKPIHKINLENATIKQFQLKNEGRCDHTYLYHIIHNYDNLADVTVFAKGSSDMEKEARKLKFTVKRVFETCNSVFSADYHKVPIHIHAHDFIIEDFYRSNHYANNAGIYDMEAHRIKPANIRPFKQWYDAHFPDIVTTKAVYSGIFSVSREHIHQHPKEYYEELIKELEGHPNPEAGHYFERSWIAVFHPIPDECIPDGIHEFFM